MERAVSKRLSSDKGISFIEVLFATGIMTVSVLGLTALTLQSMQVNRQNEVRNDAVKVASEVAETLLSAPYEEVEDCSLAAKGPSASGYSNNNPCLPENYAMLPDPVQDAEETAGTTTANYTINWEVTEIAESVKRVDINVQYPMPDGGNNTHTAVIYKHETF